jgi:hypothetical protein
MGGTLSSGSWAQGTFGDARLGDKRRTQRLVTFAGDMADSAGSSPASASGSPAALEGAYRFIRNEAVSADAIGAAGFAASARDAEGVRTLLAIEDTTTLSYRHKVAEDLGDLGGTANSKARGYFVHSALLVDADTGATVGLVDQQYWIRDAEKRGQRHNRRKRAYAEKESFKWQSTAQRLRSVLGRERMPATVSVCDREADVYEYLSHKLEHNERFVVRASRDRVLAVESADPNQRRLFVAVAATSQRGTLTVDVPQRGGRPSRTANLTVRALTVSLRRPRHAKGKLPASVEVNAVLAHEEMTRPDVEPLTWLLLTTEPINTHDDVERILRHYRLRWRVEEFHKAWKSGAGVEERRLQSPQNLHRIAVILAFVAVRLLQLRELVQVDPEGPCAAVLPDLHWKVLWATVEKKPLPARTPTLRWAFHALGRLGGWKDTKRTGRIGWGALWDGWSKLQQRLDGFFAATALLGVRNDATCDQETARRERGDL